MKNWLTWPKPRPKAGFAAPVIPFDPLAVRAALERLMDATSPAFSLEDAHLLLRSIPCEASDRKQISIWYEPFSWGSQSQLAADGPVGNASSSQDSRELNELRLGGPRNEYRVGLYTLSHVPGELRISRLPVLPDALEELSRLRYLPGSDQVQGLYQDIPREFKLLHIRITRWHEQLWKSPA
ncbi:hypothetical protein [Chromobacterium phragmitis]|nr:hypothetical protein [Chromobacterium phragmitis]